MVIKVLIIYVSLKIITSILGDIITRTFSLERNNNQLLENDEMVKTYDLEYDTNRKTPLKNIL